MANRGEEVAAAPTGAAGSGGDFACAVCYEETALAERVEMPCCFREGSTVQFCRRCVQVICRSGIDGRMGKCPSCTSWITWEGGRVVTPDNVAGTCRCCMQPKTLVDPERHLCEACLLGQTFALRYRCSRCARVQRIPHPMWRYQQAPDTPGSVTWACHVGCGDYTHWTILPDDAAGIPPEHCPESWGRREEWLQAVRDVRQQEGPDHPERPRPGCCLM
mmetsp:Transcript_29366/g.73774  ORF Transcript_29366/g.73774 Transcript_29366/m.73774 type:complete len:219 (-) Transcript_29366:133-789(-)